METRLLCDECGGTGVDRSERPVIQVITVEAGVATREAPCFNCLGHGYIIVKSEE